MIKDKTLEISLMGIFGLGGIAILIIAWVQPMTFTERIMTIMIGSSGLSGTLIRMLMSKHAPARNNAEQVAMEAGSQETRMVSKSGST